MISSDSHNIKRRVISPSGDWEATRKWFYSVAGGWSWWWELNWRTFQWLGFSEPPIFWVGDEEGVETLAFDVFRKFVPSLSSSIEERWSQFRVKIKEGSRDQSLKPRFKYEWKVWEYGESPVSGYLLGKKGSRNEIGALPREVCDLLKRFKDSEAFSVSVPLPEIEEPSRARRRRPGRRFPPALKKIGLLFFLLIVLLKDC